MEEAKRNQNQREVELLAPAGGWEQLEYALYFGADAVYLACDKFGLRQRAGNFTCEELPRAVALAHQAGARVYVTCNAFAHDIDLTELPPYVEAMRDAGVDAVIVSDLGVLSVVQQVAPELTIHVSTQASVSNAAAALMWYRLGARRIVCAREMSCAEIAALRQAIPDDLELEVFVHGAMCMAVSGRCLISDYMTGRAANKGQCVQPCRWGYRLKQPMGDTSNSLQTELSQKEPQEFILEETSRPGQEFGIVEDGHTTYLMNSKDLNMLAHIDELRAAGVDSIKIEGRVKKAFYVATVVNAYRHVLDGEPAQEWQAELETISHRPYSTGFFFGSAEQSSDADMYQQLYDWVGEVICSEQQSDVSWRVWAKCRNRFYEGDELEVLSPGKPIRTMQVSGLAEVYGLENRIKQVGSTEQLSGLSTSCSSDSAEIPSNETEVDTQTDSSYAEVPCTTANKAMAPYVFSLDYPLQAHDILRVRRKDPSRKN